MNLVELRPMDHQPPANCNYGVWRSELAAEDGAYAFQTMQQGRGGWKGNVYGSRRMGDGETHQRLKWNENRRFHSRKKRFTPFAPRNTSSFIIRAKRSGGIASLVSPPCPVTPVMLKTPVFSPLPEVLVDMAKAEWGVDSYGSMKGLIRVRAEARDEDGGELSDIDVEHGEVGGRLDLDLSRFQLTYPTVCEVVNNVSTGGNAMLDTRLSYRDMQIAQLNEEKLMINDKLSQMERDMEEMRRRIRYLETYSGLAALENAMVDSDSDMRGCCAGSEKSIGGGCNDAGQSLVLRDDVTS
uniref:Uncharacterized protein n=1 Tax=Kalanchoe fedtschenkoi TaxID=63787 RepID=A0A7N0TQ81_KALFE